MDGVLNEQEFRSLVLSMGVLKDEGEVEYLLHQVDPYNNQKVTYSEVVALLSSHMVPRDLESSAQIPMLEKFVNLDAIGGESEPSVHEEASAAEGHDMEY